MRKKFLIVFILISVFVFSVEMVITDVSPFSTDYNIVKYLVENGIMKLDETGKFKPALLVTRIDIARIIYNVIRQYNLEIINEMSKKLTEIGNDNKLVKNLFSGIDEKLSILENKQVKLNEQVEKITENLTNINTTFSKIPQLEKYVLTLMASNTALEKQFENQNLLNLAERLSNLEKEIVKKGELINFEERISSLEKIYTEVSDNYEKLKGKVSEIEKNYQDLKSSVDSQSKQTNVQVENLKNEILHISGQITEFEDKINYLNSLFEDIDVSKLKNLEKFSTLEGKVINIEDSLNKIKNVLNDYEEFKKKVEINMTSLETLKTNIEKIDSNQIKLSALVAELDSKVSEINDLKAKISEIENKMTELEKLGIYASKLNKISENIETFTSYIENTTANIDSLNEKLKKLEANNQFLSIVTFSSILLAVISFITALMF
ncbi:S-layer homology domain-containing protein [Thermosipho atlanticus]|uniref:S-layer homology domain-containing protein n=1 Tax=Thermosipho atlanticus DSM 15807 TaxID=1123380 RepID=A0A1M5R591_9BACT|nr:S-layer homology domain-containing protein [Thermosipho atlanticus]SHH20973.1 S-layer homology domain-containing protein [Thermosipho atlanticus DSM 15807]